MVAQATVQGLLGCILFYELQYPVVNMQCRVNLVHTRALIAERFRCGYTKFQRPATVAQTWGLVGAETRPKRGRTLSEVGRAAPTPAPEDTGLDIPRVGSMIAAPD
jgi:hypothetical protein